MKYLPLSLLAVCSPMMAADIDMVGAFPGKAVLVVDGGSPRAYSAGQKIAPDIVLESVDGESAVISVNGKRQKVTLGNHLNRSSPSEGASTVLSADGRGHFTADGHINGGSVRMLVDTGATAIAIPASDAIRLGIKYREGTPTQVNTANGPSYAYRILLDSVKVGDIEVHGVEAVVQEKGLPFILLGMSFLNRTEMRRNGDQMVLTKRF